MTKEFYLERAKEHERLCNEAIKKAEKLRDEANSVSSEFEFLGKHLKEEADWYWRMAQHHETQRAFWSRIAEAEG